MVPRAPAAPPRRSVDPRLERAAAYSWRLLVVGIAVAALLWLTGQLLVVVVPIAVATLLARALWPVNRILRRRGLRPALSALISLFGSLLVLGAVLALAGAAVAGEAGELGETIDEGIADVTDWLVDDSPFDVSRADVERWEDEARAAVASFVRSERGTLASGAVVAVEVLAGAVLSLIVTFFVLKDGRRWFASVTERTTERADVTERCVRRAWDAIGGYLRGAALLGVVEAAAIGAAMAVVGSGLIAPVMLITFLAAFVPIVGAVVAGVIAILVVLVTAGATQALVVAGVAIVVQQLDNDLLAPVIYGRAIRLHPLTILLGIAAGGALFGIVGTIFAVPFLAVALNVVDEIRSDRNGRDEREAA